MSDLPENLEIKREPSPPSTPEDKSPHNIKAKLNLHVKRRLQDFNQVGQEDTAIDTKTQVTLRAIKQDSQKLEAVRQKRPYHKRTDKNKFITQYSENALASAANETHTTPQRKYKHKIKQIVYNENQEVLVSNSFEENAGITAGAISAGDEDEGGHENELKPGREKEKCTDVLAMVLSMKKRALMQDPEVQRFLKEIMDVIKS